MAGMNASLSRAQAGFRSEASGQQKPRRRLLLSWEDWLTLAAAAVVFISLSYSIDSADLVRRMPPLIPTTVAGLLIGLFATRLRMSQFIVQPLALIAGLVAVVLAVQTYADGATLMDRIQDTRFRMEEWARIVWAGDISNDNLPFVTLVHSLAFLLAYAGTWAIFRWHNAWLAVIPAGILLLVNISALDGQPATMFVIYLFGALILVARIHLQKRQQAWQRNGVEYPDFISLNVAQLTGLVAIGLVLFAWMVPLGTQAAAAEKAVDVATKPFTGVTERMARVFHNVDAGASGNFHKFGDTLPISGDVSLGSRELYEVTGFEPTDGLQLLRGTSYDEYTGVGWKATDREQTRLEGGEIQVENEGAYDKRVFSTITITVSDSDSVVLFSGTPFGSNLQTIAEAPEAFGSDIEQMRPRRGLSEGDVYNSVGTVSAATPDDLRSSAGQVPGWVRDRYLQLPDDVPERVGAKASEVTAGTSNAYDAAVAIETYLRGFEYDLTVPAAPAGQDPVDYLLFELERGYFDYQSSAMAVMLRTLGIPARVAVGYAINPSSEPDGAPYRVTKSNAYSWVEVFFPEYGWIEFNPTSDRPKAGQTRPIEVPDETEPGGPVYVDDSDFDYGIEELPDLVGRAITEQPLQQGGAFPMWIIWTMLAAVAVLAATGGAAYAGWNWGMRGLSARGQMWAKTQRLGRWAGFRARDAETAREWSSRVGRSIGREEAARSLAAAYEETRYGPPAEAPADGDDTVAEAYRTVRGPLFKRIWSRGKDRQ